MQETSTQGKFHPRKIPTTKIRPMENFIHTHRKFHPQKVDPRKLPQSTHGKFHLRKYFYYSWKIPPKKKIRISFGVIFFESDWKFPWVEWSLFGVEFFLVEFAVVGIFQAGI